MISLIIGVFAYDERAKWDKYGLSLPVCRRDVVIERYIFSILLLLIAVILTVITGFISNMVDMMELLQNTLIASVYSIFLISAILPIVFKFASEKGRMIIYATVLLPVFVITILSSLGLPTSSDEIIMTIIYSIPVLAIVFLGLSMILSVKIYNKKEY